MSPTTPAPLASVLEPPTLNGSDPSATQERALAFYSPTLSECEEGTLSW